MREDAEYDMLTREAYLLTCVQEELLKAAGEGITRAELSRRLGVSRAHVTQMLNYDWNPSLRKLARLADALGCEVHVEFRKKDT